MPFTFAHPAVSVPLLRPLGRYGVLSGLVIGSFAPDLIYFLPLNAARAETHSLFGLFWFCLPVSVLSYGLFHHFMKEPLLELFPAFASRQPGINQHDSSLSRGLAIIISLLFGSITHLIWDAFTHESGQVVSAFPILQAQLFSVGIYPVYVFNLLQHISTCVGLYLVLWWSWRWLKNTPKQTDPSAHMFMPFARFLLTSAILAIPAAIGIWSGINGLGTFSGMQTLQSFASEAVFAAFPAFASVILLYCAGWQLWRLQFQVDSD